MLDPGWVKGKGKERTVAGGQFLGVEMRDGGGDLFAHWIPNDGAMMMGKDAYERINPSSTIDSLFRKAIWGVYLAGSAFTDIWIDGINEVGHINHDILEVVCRWYGLYITNRWTYMSTLPTI